MTTNTQRQRADEAEAKVAAAELVLADWYAAASNSDGLSVFAAAEAVIDVVSEVRVALQTPAGATEAKQQDQLTAELVEFVKSMVGQRLAAVRLALDHLDAYQSGHGDYRSAAIIIREALEG